MPSTYSRPFIAARSMSRRYSSSRDMHNLRRCQNIFSSARVAADFQTLPAHQINAAAKNPRQFLTHPRPIDQTSLHSPPQSHEHVQNTVRPEVLAQHRTKQGEFADPPSAAE